MGIFDVLTVLSILGAFGWLILARLNKRNPAAIEKTKEFFKNKINKETPLSQEDQWKQKYEEKRSVM